jgi:MerR family transcriptional regulator, redox-sensitive transcriptional activator SoxR
MTIGELSALSGAPASTLRYWEQMKVLPKPVRVSGQRRYQRDAVNLVAVLQLAKACGFSLGEMRRLVNGFRPDTPAHERWRTAIREHQKILTLQINRLNAMRRLLRRVECCQCVDLIECGRIASRLVENL